MRKLEKDDRIDWFRIMADLERLGISQRVMAKAIDIPRNTLKEYKLMNHRPKFEEGTRIITYWSQQTGKAIIEIPVTNKYSPF